MWISHSDKILSKLSNDLLLRRLFKIKLDNEKPPKEWSQSLKSQLKESGYTQEESGFLVRKGTISNAAYIVEGSSINILMKSGEVVDVAKASDLPNIKAISKIVKKHFLCYPKELTLPINN